MGRSSNQRTGGGGGQESKAGCARSEGSEMGRSFNEGARCRRTEVRQKAGQARNKGPAMGGSLNQRTSCRGDEIRKNCETRQTRSLGSTLGRSRHQSASGWRSE